MGEDLTEKRNLKILVAYEGTRYEGFQRQRSDQLTIQGVIEAAIEKITGEIVTIAGAGRTDSGVHARGQVVSFFSATKIPDGKLLQALNCVLPKDILVRKVEEVDPGFHARFSAKSKTYTYRIFYGELRPLFDRNFVFYYKHSLKGELINKCLEFIVGEHDFASFQAAGSGVKTTVRTVNYCKMEQESSELRLTINANGFLYHMVRNIIGTLILVGAERLTLTEFRKVFDLKDRNAAGKTAPAWGLCLEEVFYKLTTATS